jgi:hypothetical protein
MPGCGVRLDRVPSGQMMAPPDSRPRRPSSQVTLAPPRGRRLAPAQVRLQQRDRKTRIENSRARSAVIWVPRTDLRRQSIVVRHRLSVHPPPGERDPTAGMSKLPRLFNCLLKYRRPRPHSLAKAVPSLQERASGEMAEWLKAHAWKACVRETVPWVRIPLSPPYALCAALRRPSALFTKPHEIGYIFAFWSLDRFAVLRHNPPNYCGRDCGPWHGQSEG